MRINISTPTAIVIMAIILSTLVFGCTCDEQPTPTHGLAWDKVEIDLPKGSGYDLVTATTYYQAEPCPASWMDGVCASPGNYQIWYRGGSMIAVGMNLVPYGGPWVDGVGVNGGQLFFRGNLVQDNDWLPAQWAEDDEGDYLLFNLTDLSTKDWNDRWYLIRLPSDLGYELDRTYNPQIYDEYLRVIGRSDP